MLEVGAEGQERKAVQGEEGSHGCCQIDCARSLGHGKHQEVVVRDKFRPRRQQNANRRRGDMGKSSCLHGVEVRVLYSEGSLELSLRSHESLEAETYHSQL